MLGLGLSIPNSRRTGGGVQGPIVVVPVPGTLLLDAYPGAAAAYSLRQLSSTFTGAPVRVRRPTDNVEVDVPFRGTDVSESFLKSYTGGFGTNLLRYTEEFDNAFWNKDVGVTVTPNAVASPIGTLTADLLDFGVFDGNKALFAPGGAANQVFSVYIRAAPGNEGKFVSVRVNQTTLPVQVTADWQRFFIYAPQGAPQAVEVTQKGTTAQNCAQRVYLWGAQLEVGSTPTDYDYKQATAAATDAFVTTWYDQSGNARNATQATAASQPRLVLGGVVQKVNGRPSVRATDNGQRLQSADFEFNNAPFYMATVAMQPVIDQGGPFAHGVGGVGGAGFDNDGTNRQFVAFGLVEAFDGPVRLGVTELFSADFSAGTTKHFINSVSAPLSPDLTSYIQGPQPILIFSAASNAIATARGDFAGYVAEAAYYQSNQSANRAAIEANIINYFQITP